MERLKEKGIELEHARLCKRTSECLGTTPRLTWILGVHRTARSFVKIQRVGSIYLRAHYQCVLRQMQLIFIN